MISSFKIVKSVYKLIALLLGIYGSLGLNTFIEARRLDNNYGIPGLYLLIVGAISGYLGWQTSKLSYKKRYPNPKDRADQLHRDAIITLIGGMISLFYTSLFIYGYYKLVQI